MLRVMAAFGVLVFSVSQNLRSSSPAAATLDLHPHGFPTGKERTRVKAGVFYLSGNRLAVFFNHKRPSSGEESHTFQLLIVDTDGHILAQREIQADPKAVDIVAGPNGGLLLGSVGKLDFFDGDLHLLKSVPLGESVTGISFSRRLNQLVEMTIDDVSQTRSAHFLDGDTLEEKLSLSYPIKSNPVFGEKQLAYELGGDCFGTTHIVSSQENWSSLSDIPACNLLTFVGNDEIAYVFDQHLYILGRGGKQLLKVRVPAPSTFVSPGLVGISDDYSLLAISALKKKAFAKIGSWPYYNEVFVYDLKRQLIVFRYDLQPAGVWSLSLSPDGRQLAVVEESVLELIPVAGS